ncbi:MAG TPA: nuclear transport factor 2 family protein [Acidimicrobiales bacterium]|jgi:steroid delta-isomerase-like uncharacterized protein|nr:nuclear transport factor 2 family protein [Acidimicrobiales bacterium]
MRSDKMDALIKQHLTAEMAGDTAGAVAMYTDDVEHDSVGAPSGPLQGKEAAQGFYNFLTENLRTEAMQPTHRYYGEDFCVMEHLASATVEGEFLGVPGHGKRIEMRILHVWEFRDGLISRENVWLDGGTAIAQLMSN